MGKRDIDFVMIGVGGIVFLPLIIIGVIVVLVAQFTPSATANAYEPIPCPPNYTDCVGIPVDTPEPTPTEIIDYTPTPEPEPTPFYTCNHTHGNSIEYVHYGLNHLSTIEPTGKFRSYSAEWCDHG